MNTLTQIKPQLNYFDGRFDAIIGLLPKETVLDSPYYQGYLSAAIEFNVVPF